MTESRKRENFDGASETAMKRQKRKAAKSKGDGYRIGERMEVREI